MAKRNREITDTRLLETSVSTKADAERAYWQLVSSLALVDVQQRSLDLALELERTNRARVDVGQSPPLDLVAAQAEVAQRRENLIRATTAAGDSEDRLRRLIMDSADPSFWRVRLEPTDEAVAARVPVTTPGKPPLRKNCVPPSPLPRYDVSSRTSGNF